MTRIEAVLNAIQRRLPVTSNAELRMRRQLQTIERKVNEDISNGNFKGSIYVLHMYV